MKTLGGSAEVLLFSNAHKIAQMPQFHSIPPRHQTDQNTILDASRVAIASSPPDMKAPEQTVTFTLWGLAALALLLAWLSSQSASAQAAANPGQSSRPGSRTARIEGLAAWDQIYSVLMHPRCINCHTATNYPQQGDDRHRHFANVVRGTEGKGVAALQCVTCHQEANADTTGVPGAHGWHLAPLSMKWQDGNDRILSSAQVCRAVTDRLKNHGLDGPKLLEHHTEEPLVRWAFQPGRGIDGRPRTQPPLTHDAFVAATRLWVDAGTPCPPIQ
jgi:mono/diheme cytochrome c family protein